MDAQERGSSESKKYQPVDVAKSLPDELEGESAGQGGHDHISDEGLEIGLQKFVDIAKILPAVLPGGKRIVWKDVAGGLLEISVDKYSARGGNAKTIIIKRMIPVNELLFEGLGLRFGDGIKLQGGLPKVFGFSNVNLELHKHFLRFANECFGLDAGEFRVAITMPPKMADDLERIEANISRELGIPRQNFFKTRVMDRRNHPIVDIKISSTLLALCLNRLFDSLQGTLFSNESYCACMLRGIIASEANVSLDAKTKRIGDITIGAKEHPERDFIRSLLSKLGVVPDRDKEIRGQECVLITGLSNFKIMNRWKLCVLHPNKQRDFELGMSNFKMEQSRKGEGRLLVLKLLAGGPKTRQELGRLLNRSPDTIKTEALYILEKQGLVERGEIEKRTRLWRITREGFEFLESKDALERLRPRG